MNRKWLSLPLLLAGALALGSCSGLPHPAGGGGGTATFSLSLTDAIPPGTSDLNFVVTITGITLDPSTGPSVSLLASPVTLDLARLQPDTLSFGATAVPAGTYSSITVTLSSPVVVTIFNQSGATLSGCANGKVCKIPIAAAGPIKVTSSLFPIALANAQQTGVRLDFNFANAITITAGTLGVNFSLPNVLSAVTLPQGNPPAGQLDSVDDYLGVVSAVNQSAKTFTLQSLTRAPLQISATANNNTVFDAFPVPAGCAAPSFSCVSVGQVLSVDLGLNTDGTLTAREMEFEDASADDEIEGIVTSIDTSTQFRVAVTDKVQAASGTLLATIAVGDPVIVTLQLSPQFVADTKGLPIPVSPLAVFQNSTDTGQMRPGETVEVRVKSFTAGIGGNPATVAVDRVRLRFTRVTVTVTGAPTDPFFNVTGFPPFFALVTPAQVQTFGLQTQFEGVPGVTGLSDSNVVSIRALYINSAPPFFAARVRKH
jgi:hypothetical protein